MAQAAATQAAEAFGGMASAEVTTAGDAAAGHASVPWKSEEWNTGGTAWFSGGELP